MTLKNFPRSLVAFLLAGGAGVAHANCGTAFCLVNTHWETLGAPSDTGWQIDLRHEIIDQDRFWLGTREATAAEVAALGLGAQPNVTHNRNTVLTVDYGFDPRTSISVRMPYVSFELARKLNRSGTVQLRGEYAALGDAEVQLRRIVHEGESSFTGLVLGLKLPTGGTGERAAIYVDGAYDTDAGPLERSVQPGTGTTDGVLGAFHSRRLGHDWSAYAQTYARAAAGQADGYHPGRRLSADAGVSWFGLSGFTFSAQLAYTDRHRDDGIAAEVRSANTLVAASVGAAWAFMPDFRAYLFYQHPLYRKTEGVQSVADGAWVGGVSLRF